MSYLSGHAGSGSALHFGSASAADVPGMRMEMKYCELCGRPFMREAYPATAPRRECDRCVKRAEMRRAQELRELEVARQLGDPRRMMPR